MKNDPFFEKRFHLCLNQDKKVLRLSFFICLLITSTVIVSLWGGAFSYAFFYSLLLYVPLSILYLFYLSFSFRISQELDGRIFKKGEKREYSIILENSGFLPVASFKLISSDLVSQYKDDSFSLDYKLFSHESIKISNPLSCKYAGSYTAGLIAISLKDPFGLLKLSFKIQDRLRVHILPEITDLAWSDLDRIYNNTGSYQMHNDESFLGNDIRKYAPGDPVHSIHWKNYARTKQLFIRLPEEKCSELIKMVIIKTKSGMDEESLKRRDYFLEYLVSAMSYFAKNKRPLQLISSDPAVDGVIIDDYESFNKAYLDTLQKIMSHPVSKETEAKTNFSQNVLVLREA